MGRVDMRSYILERFDRYAVGHLDAAAPFDVYMGFLRHCKATFRPDLMGTAKEYRPDLLRHAAALLSDKKP